MYWSNDGAEMTVYDGLFDALIEDCEKLIDDYTEYLLYDEEDGLDDEESNTYYTDQIELCKKVINRIEVFLAKNQLSLNEGRPIGSKTDTGLDIINQKSSDCARSEAIEMLKLGRELWYWKGRERSTEAYNLMRKAYELLDRPELIRILDVHYCDRDRPSVDLIQR
jgi:hypothetical protein